MPELENDLKVSKTLISWYEVNKRELPWRQTTDPYLIWISEIILQQTRVAQGMDYFRRFVGRFPSVASLAEAPEDEVLKYWQGLGYYSRARNLRMAAGEVIARFGGSFPRRYEAVLSLKGIGTYTAAAIVSFAWNDPYPVVDGNVYRLLSRLYGVDTPIDTAKGKQVFTDLAALVMDRTRAGIHNQAIMEFGALQCVPRAPDCLGCPLSDVCVAHATRSVGAYPVKQGKTKTRTRYLHYLHLVYKDKTWLHRRGAGDIWQGLYEFPLIETEAAASFEQVQQTPAFRQLLQGAGAPAVSVGIAGLKHLLSHQVLYATFYRIEIERPSEALRNYLCIPSAGIEQYAVSRLMHIYLEKLG